MAGTASVHVGRCNYVDKAQVEHVRGLPSLCVVEHPTYHHNVPAFLEREGLLVPMIKAEVMALLRGGDSSVGS